jgi:hypothetical protein
VRPYVEYWLFAYLQASVFANRDFIELPDGEVRLSHPLNSHLAHTAALWRKACEPIAEWLARSFDRVSSAAPARAALAPAVAPPSRAKPEAKPLMTGIIRTLAPPLPTFISAAHGRRASALSVLKQRAGTKDEPVPAACWDCGRALRPEHRAFCSDDCAETYRWAMGSAAPSLRFRPGCRRNNTARQRSPASEHWRNCLRPTIARCATGTRRSYSRAFREWTRPRSPKARRSGAVMPTTLSPARVYRTRGTIRTSPRSSASSCLGRLLQPCRPRRVRSLADFHYPSPFGRAIGVRSRASFSAPMPPIPT